MYNNSYKGFKSKKYKGRYNSYGTFGKKSKIKTEKGTSHLSIIRIIIAVLAVAIFVGSICFGFSIYSKSNPDFEKSTVYSESADSDDVLMVVNRTNPVEKDYVPELKEVEGCSVNVLASSDLERMIADAKNDGVTLLIDKGYVSYEDQEKAYNKTCSKLIKTQNLTDVKAQAKAQVVTPQGGKSEFQTGLLIYFNTEGKYSNFKKTSAFKWLEKNGLNYGFVLRYTSAKQGKTSMQPSSHIFRYVGESNAKQMQRLNMCLEEYTSYLNSR
jgi:D-alanyl-D-alanine carboxypeptidase